MKFRWKRTVFFIMIGIPVIFWVMLYGTFRSWKVGCAFKEQKISFDIQAMQGGAKDYEIDSNIWTSTSEDAWITLSICPKGKINDVELDIQFLNGNVGQEAQIYYSRDDEISGNAYVEAVLYNGTNVVEFDKGTPIKTIRLDLTSSKGVAYKLDEIVIHYTREKQVMFWLCMPVLVLLYCSAVVLYINRSFWSNILAKKHSLKYKLLNAEQVISLAYSDFKSRFSGSYLGVFWSIIQPISTILLFWFVFQVGFRSNPVDGVPFILWLAAGMIPWNYFYDSWFGGTGTFVSYSYIVKKVVFDVEMLPVVKILASAILNVIFNIILLVIFTIYGEFPGYHIIDMVYFSFCIMAFTLGLSYVTATLNVFIKDVGQFLGIVLQFLMWLTPMMWNYHMMDSYSWFYKLNPLHYVINGYREALIDGEWFFHHWVQMIWFWSITIFLLIFGKKLMRKLKLHFADVL